MRKVMAMTCIAVPSASLIGRLGGMYGEKMAPDSRTVGGILDDIVKTDAFARLISEGFTKYLKAGGAIDWVDFGHFVLGHMLGDGATTLTGRALATAADVMAARELGQLLMQATEAVQHKKTGKVDSTRVAEYVLRRIKKAREGR
jgi:hypothetical protein